VLLEGIFNDVQLQNRKRVPGPPSLPKKTPINCLSDFTAYTQDAANTFSFTVSELY
jgi:hypothetical protein